MNAQPDNDTPMLRGVSLEWFLCPACFKRRSNLVWHGPDNHAVLACSSDCAKRMIAVNLKQVLKDIAGLK